MKFIEFTKQDGQAVTVSVKHIIKFKGNPSGGTSLILSHGEELLVNDDYREIRKRLKSTNESVYNDPNKDIFI